MRDTYSKRRVKSRGITNGPLPLNRLDDSRKMLKFQYKFSFVAAGSLCLAARLFDPRSSGLGLGAGPL